MEGEFYQGGQDEDLLHLRGDGAPLTSMEILQSPKHSGVNNTVLSQPRHIWRLAGLKKGKVILFFIQTDISYKTFTLNE